MPCPRITLVAGPNGAGKTTFCRERFADLISAGHYLNADEIARRLSPKDVAAAAIPAAREVLRERWLLIAEKSSFLFETTLATRTLIPTLAAARAAGFEIDLHFLWITSPAICDFRVKNRVAAGGHNIPFPTIIRRYVLGLSLLDDYVERADMATIYNADHRPTVVATRSGNGLNVKSATAWASLRRQVAHLRKLAGLT